MTKELTAFLHDCKNDLTSNDFISVINKCPKELRPELLNVLSKQGIKLPSVTDIVPLKEDQWVAFWPKGQFASLSPSVISVIQLKDLPDFEEAAYSVILQGTTGPTRIQKYMGYFYKEEDLKKSTLYNSQETDRKNYQKQVDKQLIKSLDSFKELIQQYFSNVIFTLYKSRMGIYLRARIPYSNSDVPHTLALLEVSTTARAVNTNLYNIALYTIFEKLDPETGKMRLTFYNTPQKEHQRKSKEEINDYIIKHCEEVKDLINSHYKRTNA